MPETHMMNMLYQTLVASAILAGPPLLAATLFGFLVALFQAVTQIQDQSLPQTIKIIVVVAIIMSATSILLTPLISISEIIFRDFGSIVG